MLLTVKTRRIMVTQIRLVGPLQEREQKRQYTTSYNIALDGLAWTYTLLGADAKQLATYNGVQGNFCGQPANTVWM